MILRSTILILFVAIFGGIAPALFAEEISTNTVLDETTVTKLLATTLQQQFVGTDGELDLNLMRPWTATNVPADQLTMKILDLPNSGIAPSFIVRFEIFSAAGNSLGNWQTAVQAHLWRKIRVAHSMLKMGDLVADADITRERRDVLTLHAPLADFPDGDTSLQIAESVPAGSPIYARDVKVRPVIHRGEMTNARLEDGALSVSIKVQALEDGTPGQIIHVRNLQSNRDISGKVLDESTVLVSL